MWRQFTQWLGGMGIVVLAVAILPQLRVGGRQLLQSELPGPTELERLTVSIREVARRLWILYIALTVILIALLSAYGWLGLDDRHGSLRRDRACVHDGLARRLLHPGKLDRRVRLARAVDDRALRRDRRRQLPYASFAVFVQRQPRAVTRDDEFRLYLFILLVASAVLLLELVAEGTFGFWESVRHAVFQAVSIMSTAGFATTDYTAWGAAGDDHAARLDVHRRARPGRRAGSIKVVRHVLIGRILRRELERTVHPEVVSPIRLNRSVVDEKTLEAVLAFVLIYLGLFAVGSLALVARLVPRGRRPLAVRGDGRRGRDDPRQRRPGVRLRRPARLLRELQRASPRA